MKAVHCFFFLGVVSLSVLLGQISAQDRHSDGDVDFQVYPDKPSYPPGGTMSLKFLVTYVGDSSIYLNRHLGGCSNPDGFASLEILDKRNKNAREWDCAADSGPQRDSDLPSDVTNSTLWVRLMPNEIFGGVIRYDLPRKKGTYRLKAELFPTSFTDKQREILSQNGIRVVRRPVQAPIVTITIN